MVAEVQIYSPLFAIPFGQEQIGPLTLTINSPLTWSDNFTIATGVSHTITPSGVLGISALLIVPSPSTTPATYIVKGITGDTGVQLNGSVAALLPWVASISSFQQVVITNNSASATITFNVQAL